MTQDSVAQALAASGAALRAAGVVSATYRVLPRDRMWIGVEPREPDGDGALLEAAVAAVTLALGDLAPEPPMSLEIGHIDQRGSLVLVWPPQAMRQGLRRQIDRLEEQMRHVEDLEQVDGRSRAPDAAPGGRR